MDAPAEYPHRRRLWTFHGGLQLPGHKTESTGSPIREAPVPEHLIIPLHQHIGAPAKPLVKAGDRVLKGQPIGQAEGYVCAGIHAPTSGAVVEIGPMPVPHPSGLAEPCILVASDGEDRWGELPEPWPDFRDREPADLRQRVRWAGIVGLGGAGFPTSVKLNPGPDHPVETLILNGAECEPYITCDDMLMRESAERIALGLCIMKHMLGARECLVGIEDNKPEAIQAMTGALARTGESDLEVVTIPTKYPSGGEKQLVRILTGKEVPRHGIPAHVGVVCQNVATAAAVADAVLEGKPLLSRIVTITGEGVAQPQNFHVLTGTPINNLMEAAGGYRGKVSRLIFGGPMMGYALADDAVPVTKGCNCIIAASPREAPVPRSPGPCIRCGECARVCPVELLPQQLYWYARARDFDKTQDYNLFDCIECGCCAEVCPAHIPLVQYYRFTKTEVWARERDKHKADQARQRHEARAARLERLEQERKSRLRRKKEDLEKPAKQADTDPKKAAIQAAIERAKARKASLADEGAAPRNTEQLTPAQQKQIEAVNKRRANTPKTDA